MRLQLKYDCAAESWSQILDFLRGLDDRRWLFRGQANSEWPLSTTLDRATADASTDIGTQQFSYDPLSCEQHLLLEFQRQAHEYESDLPSKNNLVDWYCLMQHYGAPTRLLDWTRSPYIGLYFAIEAPPPSPTHSALWALDSKWLQRVSDKLLGINCPGEFEVPFEQPRVLALNELLEQKSSRRGVALVNPVRAHKRLIAQQGLFACNLNLYKPFETTLVQMAEPHTDPNRVFRRLHIDRRLRLTVLRELDRMNINRASLFPGLDGFAESLRIGLPVRISDWKADALARRDSTKGRRDE